MKKKYGSLIRITREELSLIFGLPEEVEITEASWSPRDILTFKIRSQDEVAGVTHEIGEGMEFISIDPSDMMWKTHIRSALQLKEELENGTFARPDLLEEILAEQKQKEEN